MDVEIDQAAEAADEGDGAGLWCGEVAGARDAGLPGSDGADDEAADQISLFGGRGSMWGALLGTIVIQSISNGMDLLSLSSGIKFMVTGGVPLTTVTVDSVLRRSRATAAR